MQIEIEVESDRRPSFPPFIYSLTAAAAVSDILCLTAPLCKHRSLRSKRLSSKAKGRDDESVDAICDFSFTFCKGSVVPYRVLGLPVQSEICGDDLRLQPQSFALLDSRLEQSERCLHKGTVLLQVTRYAFPWEIAHHILAHVRIYPTHFVQPPMLHRSAHEPRPSRQHVEARASAHVETAFSSSTAHGFLTSSSFPGGKRRQVNGANAPHFRGITKWARWYLCSRAPPPASWNPCSPSLPQRGCPVRHLQMGEVPSPGTESMPKSLQRFPTRQDGRTAPEPQRNCRQKRCALAPTPQSAPVRLSSASASLSPSLPR